MTERLFKFSNLLNSVISLTHLIAGLSLAYILDKRLVTAMTFSILPDFDITFTFLYPFSHRGITHTLLAAFLASFLVYVYSESRESAESCLIGYLSHLGLDIITPSGLPLFFPFSKTLSLGIASAYSIWWNSAIIAFFLAAMLVKKHQAIFKPLIDLN